MKIAGLENRLNTPYIELCFYQEKADIIQKYLDAKQLNEDLSLKAFAEANNIAKSMIYNWLKDKEVIFQKCYESYDTMKNMGCRIKKE